MPSSPFPAPPSVLRGWPEFTVSALQFPVGRGDQEWELSEARVFICPDLSLLGCFELSVSHTEGLCSSPMTFFSELSPSGSVTAPSFSRARGDNSSILTSWELYPYLLQLHF